MKFFEKMHHRNRPISTQIELLWHKLKHFLHTKVKPKTKEELLDSIARFWSERVDAEKCSTYIQHLQKVLAIVVERQGKGSGQSSSAAPIKKAEKQKQKKSEKQMMNRKIKT